ncbi:MAG: hypothetical protein N3B13_06225, partial [Deltaproteobacteria bacterium]|nr:hypothetical protein [Deltaproteobacteria bacterium]
MGRWLRFEKIAFLPFRIALVLIGIVMILYFLLFLFLKSPQGVEYVSRKIRDVVRDTTGLNINLESIRLDIFTAELRMTQLGLKNSQGKNIVILRGLNASLSLPYLLFGRFVVSEISVDGIESELEIKDGKISGFGEIFKKQQKTEKTEERKGEVPDITIEKFAVSNLNLKVVYEDLAEGRVELQEISGSYVARSADANLTNLNAKVRVKNDFYNLSINAGASFLADTLSVKSLSVNLDGKNILSATGEIKNISDPEFKMSADVKIPLSYLKNYPVSMKKAEGEVSLRCNMRGKVNLPVAECVIGGEGVNIEQFKIGNFSGEVVYDSGDIQVRNFRLDNYSNRVLVNASGGIKDKIKFVGNVSIEKLELAELLRNLGVNSIVMLEIKGSVDFVFSVDPEKGVMVETKPLLSLAGPKIFPDYFFLPNRGEPVFFLKSASLSGDVTVTEKGVSLKSVDISTEKSNVKVRNSFIGFSGDGFMDLKATSDNLDFSDITPIAGLDIRGVSQLSAVLKGPFPSLKIMGDVNARGFMFENFYGGTVKVSVEFFNNHLSFRNISGRVNEMSYSGEVVLDMKGAPDIEVSAEIKEAQARNVVSLLPPSVRPEDVKKGLISLRTRLTGPVSNLSGEVETEIKDLLISRERIDRINGLIIFENGDLIVKKLLVNLYGGKIEAGGRFGRNKDIGFEIDIQGIGLGESDFIQSLPVKVSGLFGGRLKGEGSLDEPVITFSGTVDNVKVLSSSLGRITSEGSLRGKYFNISAALDDKRILFRMENESEHWENYYIKASVRDMDILRFFTENTDVTTVEDIDIDLKGNFKKEGIGGIITVKNMSANAYEMKFSLKSPVTLTLSDGYIDYSDIN